MVEGSSMVVGIQYGGCISLIRLRIFSFDISHYQYGGGTSSVQWRVCSMGLSHHQYRGGCAVLDYQKASEWVAGGCIYLGKMIFYRQS